MNEQCNSICCHYCIDAGKHNAFTRGCLQYKKGALRKYTTTVDHRAALEARSCRKDMQKAVARAHKSQEVSVIVAMKTIYFMAKKNLSNYIFGDMKQFLIHQVSKATKS